MCAVSAVMDKYWVQWSPLPKYAYDPFSNPPFQISPADIEEFRQLLERAREHDKRTHQPDCETEEKKARIKKLADELGIKVDFL